MNQVIIYDLRGQELDRMSINSDSFSTEMLASGMYIIQLFSDGAIVGSEKIKID